MKRILMLVTVGALMAVMLAQTQGDRFPYDKAYPNSNLNVENVCNANPGRFQGPSTRRSVDSRIA